MIFDYKLEKKNKIDKQESNGCEIILLTLEISSCDIWRDGHCYASAQVFFLISNSAFYWWKDHFVYIKYGHNSSEKLQRRRYVRGV